MNNRFLTSSPEMLVDVLYDEPVEVLMAADHPLSKYEQVPWSELVRYPQVVFKDGYGMQRLVQERFSRLGATLQTAMELNTLDAFRGVVRQGGLIALLPQSALIEALKDPTLAVRAIANQAESRSSTTNVVNSLPISDCSLTRQVVLVTTHDRIQIPPIQHFCQLVRQLGIPSVNDLLSHQVVSTQA
jgi:DNA-binding transcriptional LysR family regulator